MRKRDTMGEKLRGSVRKAIPVKFAVVVKTLRAPSTTARPNVGSAKYFIFTSQVTNSSAPAGTQGLAGTFVDDGKEPGSSLQPACSRLRNRRFSNPNST